MGPHATMLTDGAYLQNRYRVGRNLGQGGMGTVYEALDERFGGLVAIKQCHTTGPDLHYAFEREALLLRGLRHPGLPGVIDFFREGDQSFLVMDCVPGETLWEMLSRRRRPFSAPDVLNWADQLLGTLEYLHEHKPPVVHRDIKPDNLKVTESGDVVLLDFGLSREIHPVSQTQALHSVPAFTPQYAPLEQLSACAPDPRGDLFSTAATVYFLLTAQPPVDAATRAWAIGAGEPDPLVAPSAVNPLVSERLSAILLQGLALDPDRRPQTAAAMRASLRTVSRAGAGTTVVACTNPAPAPAERPDRRAAWRRLAHFAIALGSVLVAAGMALGLFALWLSSETVVVPVSLPEPAPPALAPPAPATTAESEQEAAKRAIAGVWFVKVVEAAGWKKTQQGVTPLSQAEIDQLRKGSFDGAPQWRIYTDGDNAVLQAIGDEGTLEYPGLWRHSYLYVRCEECGTKTLVCNTRGETLIGDLTMRTPELVYYLRIEGTRERSDSAGPARSGGAREKRTQPQAP